jgi:hypothetical protein
VSKKNGIDKSPELENAELAVVENSKWVDSVLWSMLLAALATILLKIFGKQEFKWMDITVDTSFAWIVFSVLTLAHFYTALLLFRSIRSVWQFSDRLSRQILFAKITSTGGIFVRGLAARTVCKDDWCLTVRYTMDHRDPSSWLALVSVPFLIAAVTPYVYSKRSLCLFFLGLALAEINWIIGSHWIIALSDLSTDSHINGRSEKVEGIEGSFYFRKSRHPGIRMIGIQSGGDAFEPLGPIAFPIWFLLNCILRILKLLFLPINIVYYLYRSRSVSREQ